MGLIVYFTSYHTDYPASKDVVLKKLNLCMAFF
jgi:hypothetical protein